MRGKITLILFFLLAGAVFAGAHPLGNFSINNFTRIEIEKNRIRLRCVLDMAEIPTYQESQKIDADKNGALSEAELNAYLESLTPQYLANLKLAVDENPVRFETAAKNISRPEGAGNLPTLRAEWTFTAESVSMEKDAVYRLRFENNNFKERAGWNEIVVNRLAGVNIFDSTAFGSALTDELKTYPENMLSAPLAERAAEFSLTASAVPENAAVLQNRNGSASTPVQKDKFAELISVPEITPAIALAGLLLAFGFGALHAMSPGHGKTVVGAYLVGSRGTVKHAAFLGLTVTITHTLGVFALGLITLFASNYILPEKILPFLSFVSGLLVFYIGVTLFKSRLFGAFGLQGHHGHGHSHGHDEHFQRHEHDGHEHSHEDGRDHSHEHHDHHRHARRRFYAHARRADAFAPAARRNFVEKSSGARHFGRITAVPVGAGFDAFGDFFRARRVRSGFNDRFQLWIGGDLDGRRTCFSLSRKGFRRDAPGGQPDRQNASGFQRVRNCLRRRGNLL